MLKMVTHIETQSFEMSKLESFLEKLSNTPLVTGICDPPKY